MMAFIKLDTETQARMADHLPMRAAGLRTAYRDATAELLAVDPADTAGVLAAIKTLRDEQDELQSLWDRDAALLIASGLEPDRVCAALGTGRTALQQRIMRNPQLERERFLVKGES